MEDVGLKCDARGIKRVKNAFECSVAPSLTSLICEQAWNSNHSYCKVYFFIKRNGNAINPFRLKTPPMFLEEVNLDGPVLYHIKKYGHNKNDC